MIINEHTIPDYDLEDLRKKMAYIDYIPVAMTTPQEMWYHPEDETTYFLLRITEDAVFVVIAKNGLYQGFDVIFQDNDQVNALRCGVLKYSVNKTD